MQAGFFPRSTPRGERPSSLSRREFIVCRSYNVKRRDSTRLARRPARDTCRRWVFGEWIFEYHPRCISSSLSQSDYSATADAPLQDRNFFFLWKQNIAFEFEGQASRGIWMGTRTGLTSGRPQRMRGVCGYRNHLSMACHPRPVRGHLTVTSVSLSIHHIPACWSPLPLHHPLLCTTALRSPFLSQISPRVMNVSC